MPDRAAIVTGGSRGIGLAIAQALGEDGYGVTLAARKPEPLEQAAEGLRDNGLEVEQVAANLVDEEGIRSVVARHRERFGRLDVLYSVCDSLYEEFKRPEYAPPPLLKRMVASGRLGRKTGHGFYEYEPAPSPVAV